MGMLTLGVTLQPQPWHNLSGEVSASISDHPKKTRVMSGVAWSPILNRAVEGVDVLWVSFQQGTGLHGSRGPPWGTSLPPWMLSAEGSCILAAAPEHRTSQQGCTLPSPSRKQPHVVTIATAAPTSN